MTVATMQVLAMEETELELVPLPGSPSIVCVAVPGFGHVLLRPPSEITGTWGAALAKGPGTLPRPLPVLVDDDGRLRVPMLHTRDRLDVIVDVS